MKKIEVKFNRERIIGEHTVVLPEPPKDLTSVMNYNLPKEKQVWKAIPFPENYRLLSRQEQSSILLNHKKIMEEGFWFFNNGNLEYMTGRHYFFCNYWHLDGKLAEWREAQAEIFYLWEKVVSDKNCAGLLFLADRRTGKSAIAGVLGYLDATSGAERHFGMQSKTDTDAKKLFKKVIKAWKKIPAPLKPIDSGDSNPQSALKFEEPAKRSVKGDERTYKKALDSIIDYESSVVEAYDSDRLTFLIQDEIGKKQKYDPHERWYTNRPTLIEGFDYLIGKAFVTSTVEDLEKGGGAAYKLWKESDPKDLDGNGRNTSWLLRYFKTADNGLKGYIDKYGYSLREKAKEVILKDRLNKSGEILSSIKRKYPLTISEAFIIENKDAVLPMDKINEQREYNDTIKIALNRGNFIENEYTKKVEFIADPDKGRWKILWMPDPEERNLVDFKNGRPKGGNGDSIKMGIDPFDNKTTSDNRKSMGGAHIFRKYQAFDPLNSNIFVAEYIARPPLPEIFYEDMRMAAVFYGADVLVEINKIGIVNHFRNKGYYEYLIDRPEQTYTQSQKKQKEKGVPMSGDTARGELIDGLIQYIYKHIGLLEQQYQDFDMDGQQVYANMPFQETLEQWAEFNFDKWTDYDAVVSSGLAIMAAKTKAHKPKRTVSSEPLFKVYDLKNQ